MVFILHKFKHYLSSNKFVFYGDHMALVYLVNKPQVLGRIARWLLLVTIEKFEINLVLVNVKNLKPYKYMEFEIQKQQQ